MKGIKVIKHLMLVVLFFSLLLTPHFVEAASPNPPPVDPTGMGRPALVPTIDTPIKCGQSVPKDAILGPNATLPAPSSCIGAMSKEMLAARRTLSLPAQVTSAQVAPKGGVTTQDTLDTLWGYKFGAGQLSKSGVAAQVSAVVPTYTNVGRKLIFRNYMVPTGRACIYAGVVHDRYDPVYGSYDNFVFGSLCGGAAYTWNFTDPTVQSLYVRNDIWGSPYMYMAVDQTNGVGNCFNGEAWNYTSGYWVVTNAQCGYSDANIGLVREDAINLTTPTSVCVAALNPYMYKAQKRIGTTWSNLAATDLTPDLIGPCTQGTTPPYSLGYSIYSGFTLIIFYQGGV